MNQSTYNLHRANFQLFKNYPFLFSNKAAVLSSISDYFTACGYKADEEPFLNGVSQFGCFHPDVLIQYKDYFLYNLPQQGGVSFNAVFNVEGKLHIWAYVYNLPEQENGPPRFIVSPAVYSTEYQRILDFYESNERFLIKPSQKSAGFGNLI